MEETTEIKNICEQIAYVYRDKMSNAGYDKNGELMNFTWVTEYKGNLFSLYFNLPDYFQFAENGRNPGKFPPPDAILKWIQTKRLIPKTKNGKIPSTKQLVYLISRKIALKGTQGKHLLQQTIDETFNTLVDQLVDLIAEQLETEIDNEVNNLYE